MRTFIPAGRVVGVVMAMLSFATVSAPGDEPNWRKMQKAVLETADTRAVEELLAAGVDVNAPIGCGAYTPVDGAMNTGNVAMFKLLMKHGAKPTGFTLHLATWHLSGSNAVETVQAILDAGVSPNDHSQGTTALTTAAYRNDKRLVALLLSRSGIDINGTTADGYTALMCAVEHSSFEIADVLLKAGARVDLVNKNGETAQTLAEKRIQKEQELLLRLKPAAQSASAE